MNEAPLITAENLGVTFQTPKGRVEAVRPYSMTLQECNWRWVRAPGLSLAAFRAVLRRARVTASEEHGPSAGRDQAGRQE